LLERHPEGVEEVAGDGWTELAVYVDQAGERALRAWFPDARADEVAPDWEDRWRTFHRPVRAGGIWIGPPWEEAPAGDPAVVVDPGRAFGTGAHPTTRACIELLASLARRGSLLDAGCGSGVLAVAAVRLGYRPVLAADVDPHAVEVAAATAARNGVEIEVGLADVLSDPLPEIDVLVANLDRRSVERVLARRPSGTAVTSGYLAHERPDAPGWRTLDRRELEGWAADVLEAA